jgi:hypothetical protein
MSEEVLPQPGYIAVPISPTDYIKNVNSPLGAVGQFQGFDWRTVYPTLDLQNKNGLETSGCVSWSAVQFNEMVINAMIKLGTLPETHIDFLVNDGYLVDGLMVFSKIFIWNLSGTTPQGNDFTSVGNAVHKNGLIPESMCPFNPSQGETWAQLKSQPITQAMLDQGQKFLQYFSIGYHYLSNPNWTTDLADGPIQIAIPVCPGYNTADPIQACGYPEQHSVLIAYMNGDNPQIVDHYIPEIKDLVAAYPIMAAMQQVVTINSITQGKPMYETVVKADGKTFGVRISTPNADTIVYATDEAQWRSWNLPTSYQLPTVNSDGTTNWTAKVTLPF